MTSFQIREMTGGDLDAVGDVTAAGNFGDRREFFRLAVALSSCRPIVAMSDGHPIGTGLGSIHGDVGWVGVIFVTPELRGRGIGRAQIWAAPSTSDLVFESRPDTTCTRANRTANHRPFPRERTFDRSRRPIWTPSPRSIDAWPARKDGP